MGSHAHICAQFCVLPPSNLAQEEWTYMGVNFQTHVCLLMDQQDMMEDHAQYFVQLLANRMRKLVRQALMQTGARSKIHVYQFMGQWGTMESLARDAALQSVLLTKFLALRGMTLMVVSCQILAFPLNTRG